MGSDLERLQMRKEPFKACCIVAKLTGFDHLPFLHRQTTHQGFSQILEKAHLERKQTLW
jgi:hypothetical protein